MVRPFENTFSVDSKNISFVCNYYLIHPDSIFYYARVSFLMILIITLITIIMIIYLNLTEGNTTHIISSEDDDIEETEAEEAHEEDSIQQEDSDSQAEVAAESSEEPENTEESEAQSSDSQTPISSDKESSDSSTATDTAVITDSPESDTAAEASLHEQASQTSETKTETPVELPVNDIKPAAPQTDNPAGLYNSETGIGWESYLESRLDNEIERATASEIDLALFIFKLPENKNGTVEFKNVCNYLAIQFQFKDLLFEHNDDSIVAIKISMDVDSAISFADKLYNDISNIIENKKCYIGITSRSIRMVTGERLMLEAEQAVEHAIEDKDSPIIAFRVDSDKYRQMLEQN